MTRQHRGQTQHALSLLVLIALLAGSVFEASAQRRRKPRSGPRTETSTVERSGSQHTIAAGTVIRLRMNQGLSPGNARVGDRFSTTVAKPVHVGGAEVIPTGSVVTGRVTTVKPAAKGKAGGIGVEFISLRTPRGNSYPINGSIINLQADTENDDNEGSVSVAGKLPGDRTNTVRERPSPTGLQADDDYSDNEETVNRRRAKPTNNITGMASGALIGMVLNRSVSLPASNAR